MKKLIITVTLALSFGVLVPVDLNAASTNATTQTALKKGGKKNGVKKSTSSKKYVPASIGDCYIGEAMYYQSEPQNIELTLLPNGTCEWKADGKLIGKGTFSGTITGKKYVVNVNVPTVGKYTFKGTKDNWSFEAPRESITLSLEY
ncbi:MAG: hypothetical protein K2N05_07415 [Muribaculaceae bacterium]|nr:hypothetical protein [Muribaculaceae bacterium]